MIWLRYQEEIRFLENVEKKEETEMNSRRKWNDEQVRELVERYPSIPKDYLDYLKEIGTGSFRECQFSVHGALETIEDLIGYSLYDLTKSSTDFDCLPMGIKVKELLKFIIRSGNNEFLIDDLKELFSKSNLKSPRTGRVINPTQHQLNDQIDRLIRNNEISVIKIYNIYRIKNND